MTEPPSRDPAPEALDLTVRWPGHRQLVVDGVRVGAALGVVVGVVTGGREGWVGLVVGALLGGLAAAPAGRRLYRLRVDGAGLRIGRLMGTTTIPWPEVVAMGRREDWHGRSGRLVGLAVCRRGELLPVPVPALTWTASALRMGGEHPIDRLARFRDQAIDPLRPWAAWQAVPVVEDDLDAWWDRHPDADPDR